MFDVITIGAATVDIFAKSDQLVLKDSILGIKPSSKCEISQSLICAGGGAVNSSVSFSRLGFKSACISLAGSDHLNNFIFDELKSESVDIGFINKAIEEPTDYSIILVSKDGTRSILTNRGKTRLEEKHVKWSKIKNTKWFYITSLEGNLDLLEKIIGFALENNIKVALNPGNRELNQKRLLVSLLKHVDFLLLNKIESEELTGLSIDDDKFWNKISSYKSKTVAITNGRNGANLVTGDNNYYSPIINVKPVDETGAGDSFGSAYVAAILYEKSPSEALFWGIKNSASVVSYLGSKTGLLTLKKINKK